MSDGVRDAAIAERDEARRAFAENNHPFTVWLLGQEWLPTDTGTLAWLVRTDRHWPRRQEANREVFLARVREWYLPSEYRTWGERTFRAAWKEWEATCADNPA